jgi:hypothetical protein
MIHGKYSFKNATQLFQGNNVLDAPASSIDGFYCTDTCVFNSAE